MCSSQFQDINHRPDHNNWTGSHTHNTQGQILRGLLALSHEFVREIVRPSREWDQDLRETLLIGSERKINCWKVKVFGPYCPNYIKPYSVASCRRHRCHHCRYFASEKMINTYQTSALAFTEMCAPLKTVSAWALLRTLFILSKREPAWRTPLSHTADTHRRRNLKR